MANTGLGTASTALKGIGGIASMIPGWGTFAGAGLSALGGVFDVVDAQTQKEEAEKIQREAEKVKKQPIEKEYLQALRGKKMLALSGLPEYERAKENIDLGAANALKSIQESSVYGGSVVDAINAVLNKGSQQKADIDVQQATAKLGLQKDVLDTLWNVGGMQRELTKEQRARQEALYSQAQDLMAASTANKQIGREKAIGAGIQGVGALSKLIGSANFGTGVGKSGAEQSVTPLDTSGMATPVQNVSLAQGELADMKAKVIAQGLAQDDATAEAYLKSIGFNF